MKRLIIFAKVPVPGTVKTRLQPLLGPAGATRVYEGFVADVTGPGRQSEAETQLYFAGAEQPGPVLERTQLQLRQQRGADLGDRLASCLTEQTRDGADRIVVLGCDSPDLPRARVSQAFELLATSDVVLGPAVDGGYYLLGVRGIPPILKGIAWGTSEVLAQTLEAVRNHGLTARLLEPWYDVDRPQDLRFLKTHLDFLAHTTGEDRCPATRPILDDLMPAPPAP